MAETNSINDTAICDTITRAVQDVFKTMLGQTARRAEPAPADGHSLSLDGPQVVGTVGFVGDINGLIYLYLNLPFARAVAMQMLGMDAAELDEAGDDTVNDVIGELTNMTVGVFKNELCDRGYPCKLTIPSILRGSNFSIEPITSATRRIYRFEIGAHHLTADLLMKQGD